jgi:hypothetical protein
MLKLTEENLANWPQMSQADRVDLIQTKLEVEADAQKILLKEGGPNVDRAMVQEHLTNIEDKLGELDKAKQAGRVPEWIEHAEEPRLFSNEGEEASKSAGTVQVGTNAPNKKLFSGKCSNAERKFANLSNNDLKKLGDTGDTEATFAYNFRDARKAYDRGNIDGAFGKISENIKIDRLGNQVLHAGRDVKFPSPGNPGRSLKSDIDIEATNELIEIKSGNGNPSNR